MKYLQLAEDNSNFISDKLLYNPMNFRMYDKFNEQTHNLVLKKLHRELLNSNTTSLSVGMLLILAS